MGIIKRLAKKVLERDLLYTVGIINKKMEEALSIFKERENKLNEEIKKRDEKIAELQTVIGNQSNDIIKLRKLTEKRPYFKRKKK